jgi:enterochelin esterase-like enzyme
MQPNDLTFVALLFLLTLAVAGFAILSWKWKRWQLARRLTVVFFGQLMVLVTLVGYVNADQGFYTTWTSVGTLFGVQPQDNNPQQVFNRQAGNAPGDNTPNAIKKGVDNLGPGILNSLVDRADASKSQLLHISIHGKRTGYTFGGLVYLPGSYNARSEKNRKYPVVELFSGYPGSPYAWPVSLNLKAVLDEEIRSGRAPAMIAVMPGQDPAHPKDSECVNDRTPGGAQAATWLGEDVPDAISSMYRTRSDRHGWGLMGLSTGGFCAANLALQYPQRFFAAVALSGYFNALTDNTTGDLYQGSAQARLDNSPQWSVTHRKHLPLDFYVFAAQDSVEDQASAVNFAKAVLPPDGVTLSLVPNGGHTSIAWKAIHPAVWDWLGQRLR